MTCIAQRARKRRAEARSDGGGARALKSGLRAGLQRKRRQSSRGNVNVGAAEKKEGVGAARPRRSLRRTLEGVRKIVTVSGEEWGEEN